MFDIYCLYCHIRSDDKKLIRRWDSERELSLRRLRLRTIKYNTWLAYSAQQSAVQTTTEAKQQNIVVDYGKVKLRRKIKSK